MALARLPLEWRPIAVWSNYNPRDRGSVSVSMSLQTTGLDDRLLSLALRSERFRPPRTPRGTEYLWLAFALYSDGTVVRMATPEGIPDRVSLAGMLHLMRQPDVSFDRL